MSLEPEFIPAGYTEPEEKWSLGKALQDKHYPNGRSEKEQPAAIYVWLVPSEQVLEQPGSWRIRKWDTEPFPEANYALSATPPLEDVSGSIKHLRSFVDRELFWDQQPYGTRFYYGDGGLDYIQRGLLRSIVEAFDAALARTTKP